MKDINDTFLEDQIFGNNEQYNKDFEDAVSQNEIEEINSIYHKEKKLEIINTNIVCDGRDFEEFFKDKIDNFITNFSKYNFNNFKITNNNDCLNELEEKGVAICLSTEGDLMLRVSQNSEFKNVMEEKASKVISNILRKPITVGQSSKNRPPDIPTNDLMLISETTFDPNQMFEFYKEGNSYKYNKFKPSKYLMLNENLPYKKPTTILKLITHLVNYDENRFNYFLNWLSYMFVFLTKPQVAVVLKGVQGSGKGFLFSSIISILFGEDYCFTVGNKTLKSQFLGSIFENKLFVNFNEMSHDIKSNKENKNSLKELVSDDKFAGEKKYENISKHISLFAAILITSNEVYILEVEAEDRRFTIFSTAGNISSDDCNFFGLGDFRVFKKQIQSELRDFALYLKNYPIDVKLANKALNTPEKKALIKGTNDRFKLFINVLLNKDTESLESLKISDSIRYANIISGFKKGRIYQRDILSAYIALNPSDFNISTQALLDKLEIYEPTKFSRELRGKSGDWYFNL